MCVCVCVCVCACMHVATCRTRNTCTVNSQSRVGSFVCIYVGRYSVYNLTRHRNKLADFYMHSHKFLVGR